VRSCTRGQIFASRAEPPERRRNVSLAIQALLDLLRCTALAPTPLDPTPHAALPQLWTLSSPWRHLAEGRFETYDDEVLEPRQRMNHGGCRHSWRNPPVNDPGSPPLTATTIRDRPRLVTGRPFRRRADGGAGGQNLPLVQRALTYVEAWVGRVRAAEEREGAAVTRTLLLKALALLGMAGLPGGEGQRALDLLGRAQGGDLLRVVKEEAGAVVVVEAGMDLLSVVPLCLAPGSRLTGRVSDASTFAVEEEEEEELPEQVRDEGVIVRVGGHGGAGLRLCSCAGRVVD
jgi:hypothetical protein